MMDTGAPADSPSVEGSLFNPSSSDREEAISTLINPIQPDNLVTPSGVSTTCNLAGDAAGTSSGSTNFGGGEMHAEEKPRPGAIIGARGITKLDQYMFPGGYLYTMIPNTIGGFLEFKVVYVDSFPSEIDQWWMPPLHGEDVSSLSDNLVEELDEQRLDYTQFTRILEAHGCQCSSIEKDFLLCFENEKELQHSETRRDNRQGTGGSQTPEQAGFVSPYMKSTVSAFFHFSRDQGRIVRPSTEELERCLDGIPEHLGEAKNLFKSLNDQVVSEVKSLDWKMACEQYEACLILLENLENNIAIHIQTWLFLWVCIPLVDMYQLRLRNYPKCVKIYDRMLQQLNREMDSLDAQNQKGKSKVDDKLDEDVDEHDALIVLYYTIIWHRRLVLFEWSYAFEKDGNQLLANYVRSKVFNKVKVQKIHFAGFVQLQRMINYWGRRRTQGREGDMRVALCFNLEHLYRESKQQLKAVQWTREKWRWIRDETHELKDQLNLKFEDVTSLFAAGMEKEGQIIISDLERNKSTLPPVVSNTIDHWKAKFLLESSRPKEAKEPLQKLRKDLGKSSDPRASELLARMQWDLSKLNSRLREAEMLEHTPFKVEMIDWSDENDSGALLLTKEFKLSNSAKTLENLSGSSVINLTHGQQLLDSIGKRFPAKDIETYRDRLHDAMDFFEGTLRSIPEREDALRLRDEVISHEEIVHTQHRISKDQIICHESLGVCCAYAHRLKPRGVKYNVEDLKKELPVYDEGCLDKGIKHLEKSLDLAEKNGHDGFLIRRITAKLGWIHFAKVIEYDNRVQKFISLIPEFRSQYYVLDEASRTKTSRGAGQLAVERNCGNICHDHVYILRLGLDELVYGHMQKTSTDSVDAFARLGILIIRRYRSRLGLNEKCLTDEDLAETLKHCAGLLLRGLMLETKRSIDYIKRSLEMGYGQIRTFDTSSNEKINLVPSLSMVETTKKIFTLFQRLMVYEENVRVVIKDDELLQNLVATPETAEYLRSQPDDLTPSQKALLWAERGRSRSLMYQLLTNKLPEEPINNMVNFNMTDQEAWTIFRTTQLSYGENTVFVEYTFDSIHEFVSEVIGTGKSDYDWKSCNWIIYVVTKEGEVHMRSYQSKIPAISVAQIHKYLSNPLLDQAHDMAKKNLVELYDAFIRPISDLLDSMKPEDKLVFALDEVLTNVPFPILLNSETGKYLFENHTISFTPALRVLVHCEQRHISLQASQTVAPSVALGDPAYPPKGRVKRLEHTYHEIMSIPPLFNDGCVKILTGTEATADNLLMHHAKLPVDTVQGFVHVAAHGFVDKNHKSGSLQLAYSSVEQGPPLSDHLSSRRADDYDEAVELEESTHSLTDDFAQLEVGSVRGGEPRPGSRKAKEAEEAKAKEKACLRPETIMQCGFEWRSYMVVLSACNSAKGYVLGSEGVVGLPRAFLVAGVPCIVASQWSLEDRSSAELMQEFYREMSRGRDASSALRAAMLRMMKPEVGSLNEQVDVYKWGGYLVWGSPTVTLPPSMLKIE